MAVKYGTFPRALVIVSGVIATYLAIVALVSHPFGFAGSAIIMLLWGLFSKLVVFGFEPQHFLVLGGPKKKKEKPPLQELGPKELPDWSGIAESICSTPSPEGASDRVLPGANRSQVAKHRIIGRPAQEEDSTLAAEREEDKAWAEMFRAL